MNQLAYRHIAIMIWGWILSFGILIPLSAQNTLPGGVCKGTIQLTAHTTLTSTITIEASNTLTIDLNGYVLTKANDGRLFEVDKNQTLIITDSNPNTSNTGKWGLDGEDVTISGGVITGGVAAYGGAILVKDGGRLELLGGTIAGCKAETTQTAMPYGCGGAICVEANGFLKISGGNIAYCQSELEGISTEKNKEKFGFAGGAIYIVGNEANNTTDFFFDKGRIYNCKANNGGGIYLQKADFEMKGNAEVANCYAIYAPVVTGDVYGGGGIYVSDGRMTMDGNAMISGNKSGRQGQGVHVEGSNAMFTLNNGTISDNEPYYWDKDKDQFHSKRDLGGGICVNKGKLIMNGGVVSKNASSSGGGIMLNFNGVYFEMNGGEITGNKANGKTLGNGGGIYLYKGTFKFNQGKISGNYARRYGGAVNINDGATFSLNGNCLIENNTAGHGGGLSQEQGNCQIALSNAGILIKNNVAQGTGGNDTGNGGGVLIEKGTLNISAGTIQGNKATGNGGGISLWLKRITGDITVNMNGGNILNNTANNEGGGIDIYANKDWSEDDQGNGDNHINDVLVYLNSGTFQENTAAIGGGVHVGVNQNNSVANMYVGTASTSPDIIKNNATQNGGGLAMDNGSIEVINGNLNQNLATGNGGGIYIKNGDFKISDKAVISQNSAKNGGGFCVEEGSVTIKEGDVSTNKASGLGGGLYVTTSSTEPKTVTFDGGVFSKNEASAGGGVAVEGNIALTMNGNVENNTATNGGGIYLNSAKMNFGAGLIRFNRAVSTSNLSSTTGYKQALSALHGMGGGIYLDSSSELNFTEQTKMGLYDNTADNGADDIFANGNSTSITLPNVASMILTGLGNAGELFWVEDYITDDTGYGSGTKANTSWDSTNSDRYRDAVKNNLPTYKVTAPQTLSSYVCLALGHEIIYITIIKEGLAGDESAIFQIQKEGDTTNRRTLLLTGISGNNSVSKKVALTTGSWTVTETDWSWSYNLTTPTEKRSITKEITTGTEFKFVNQKKSSLPLYHEAKVENNMEGIKKQ